ncbi:SusC/RagA family TonB-linked outer membrane protein [Pedobacter ginsenosidimutans]|uniref:SusC/RagA family TonB-linked outer membrane protein n=1 Tax=Pedobacter ginsenosidimutans TaxID=687842 RepID=A0A0T5VVE9_9SPHI|nr:SusC/RagA family TonB-linked outer membrane protein [Pedobacter ginsenosidimutans]KRT17846.1 SusC/RagA family TonB-linked outer membrane protein [Pedobacter ginsenosidimutans]
MLKNYIILKNNIFYSYLILFFVLISALPTLVFAQAKTINGTVKDSKNNELLPGVVIKVQNGSTATSTDANGKFQLQAQQGDMLIISFVGYAPKTIPVPASNQIEISLTEDTRNLDDVVVIGYGTMKKKDLTGAITQIKPDKIADQNPNTAQDILRGTPGVTVGFDASAKGGGSIQIRGQRSVYTAGGRNDPLLVLDGALFYGELSEINPDDIESMDVLKDASAAAVYGAKSANGVIIITTKKGKVGKPRINFTSNFALATMAANRPVFDAKGYMQYREDWYTAPTYGINTTTGNYEAYQSTFKTQPGYFVNPTPENLAKYGVSQAQWKAYTASGNGTASDNEIWARRLLLQGTALTNFLSGETFDWYDHSFRTGKNQDYNLSVSGGSDKMNYYMSMGYLSNEGVAKGNDYTAIRSNLKVEGKVTNWLEIGANVNFQNRTDGDLTIDWGRQIIANAPFASYKDANGNLLVHPMGDLMVNNYGWNYDFDRQYRDLDRGYTIFNTILSAKVKLPFNIQYSFTGSPRYQFFHDRYWESASHPDWKGTNGLVNREQTQRYDWSLNNTLYWEHTFGKKHRVNVTFVQEAEKKQSWLDRIEARNILPSDALGFHETFYGDKNRSSYDSDDVKETADGLLGRLFYSYDDKYMLTTSFRRDGYSAFGTSNPRANFFSAAFAWTFTNEKFIKWKPLNSGKFRVSWGQNGNRQLGDPYLALANLGAGVGATTGYLDASGNLIQYRYLTVGRLANPDLHWEKTEALNVGLNLGFFNDRLTADLDYYITPTVDMIMNRSLPGFTGFGSITTNLGKVENRGFEVALTGLIVKNNNFSWSSTLGFSKYKNTIKHLYYVFDNVLDAQGNVTGTKERDDIGNGWFIGQPISAIWNYRVTGIWQANEATEAARYGQRPGDPKVANNYTADDVVNANGTVTPVYNDRDKEFLGQAAPPIMWSVRNDFTYKNFNFSFNIYSYWGHKSLSTIYLNQDNGTSGVTNLTNAYQKEYWTLENPSDVYARLDAKGPAGVNSPGRLFDRSFVRLENLTLGYTVPQKFASKIQLEKVKLFATVRNVAVWAKDKNWDYWDIETGGLAPRIYTFGLNVTF